MIKFQPVIKASKLFLLVLCTTCFLSSCEKQYIKKHYTGDFTFTVANSGSTQGVGWTGTTVTYNGTIEYVSDKNLRIEYLEDKTVEAEVDKKGVFVTQNGVHEGFSGQFESRNEVNFVVTGGSLCCNWKYGINGKRN